MDFRVLGPMAAATEDGAEIPLGGPKQRSVLALLLVKADQTVDTDVIVEELYPELGSGASRKTVQVYVSRLRSGFAEYGDGEIIRARPSGYEVDAAGHRVDAIDFETALRRGRSLISADPDAASRVLQDGLALWRGRPFEDAHPTPELDLEAARLEEQRLAALEAWAEAELAAGRHREVAADLERLADEHPLREGIWALLMLALYRSGRQAEALRAYAELKQRLGEELGIEPNRELIDIEGKMLLQDPSLDAPRRVEPKRPPRRSNRWIPIAGAVVVAALLVGLVALLLRSDGTAEPGIGSRYLVPEGTTQIAAAGNRVWLIDPGDPAVTAFDPEDGVSSRHELHVHPSAIATGLGFLWVVSEESGTLLKVGVDDGQILLTTDGLDLRGAALAVGDEAVYAIREHVNPFLEADPETLEVETLAFEDGFGGPAEPSITVAGGTIWGANSFIGRIMTLDPVSGEFDFAGDPGTSEHSARSILSNHGGIWYSQPTNGSVTFVSAESSEVQAKTQIGATGDAGFGPGLPRYGLANGPGGMWVASPEDGKVALLDDGTAEVLAEIGFDRPVSITATVGRVWVLDAGAGQLVEILPASCDETPFIGAGADLRGCDLVDKVLIGLDLTGADLRWADLSPSALQGVDFTGADLYGADLSGAAVDDVIWSGTRCPDGTLSDINGGTCVGHIAP